MAKHITIIGSGATALAAAATFTLKGIEVTLTDSEENAQHLNEVKEKSGILLYGNGLRGLAEVPEVTTDVVKAVSQSEIILVSVVSWRHEEVARRIIPGLRDGQVIVIIPGNAGSLVFDSVWKQEHVAAKVLLVETQGNLFPCRLTGPAQVVTGRGIHKMRVSAFPGKNTEEAIAKLEGILELEKAENVFETALNSANVVNHLTASILNTSAIEKVGAKFNIFQEGLTPSVLRGLEEAGAEWEQVLDAAGLWRGSSPVGHWKRVAQKDAYPELNVFRSLAGPDSLHHRYIREDASSGVALIVSLAKKTGVPVPFTEGVLRIASVLNDTDFYAQGRTLENFGLDQLTLEEIKAYLNTGVK